MTAQVLFSHRHAISRASANVDRAVWASQAGSMRTASGFAGRNVAADRSHRRVVRANAMRQPAGRSDAAVPTERIARSELAPLLEKDARSATTVPASPGRWIPSAGVAASGPAVIGRVAISSSAAYHRADSLRGMR